MANASTLACPLVVAHTILAVSRQHLVDRLAAIDLELADLASPVEANLEAKEEDPTYIATLAFLDTIVEKVDFEIHDAVVRWKGRPDQRNYPCGYWIIHPTGGYDDDTSVLKQVFADTPEPWDIDIDTGDQTPALRALNAWLGVRYRGTVSVGTPYHDDEPVRGLFLKWTWVFDTE